MKITEKNRNEYVMPQIKVWDLRFSSILAGSNQLLTMETPNSYYDDEEGTETMDEEDLGW